MLDQPRSEPLTIIEIGEELAKLMRNQGHEVFPPTITGEKYHNVNAKGNVPVGLYTYCRNCKQPGKYTTVRGPSIAAVTPCTGPLPKEKIGSCDKAKRVKGKAAKAPQ